MSVTLAPTRSPRLAFLLLALSLLTACGGGGGGATPAPPPVTPRDWGPIPTELRQPGDLAPASYVARIEVQNRGGARTETVCASVPFPWGRVTDLTNLAMAGRSTAWRVLQRWPDRSVRVAQAQWVETLAANATIELDVVPGAALVGAFTPHPMFAGGLPWFGSEVEDTFGVLHRAGWAEAAEVLHETPLVRVRRLRTYHWSSSGGLGRNYLTATYYVTEFSQQPLVLVDCVLGNDYLGADNPNGSSDPNLYPLGDVDVKAARFATGGWDQVLPYRASSEGIGAPVVSGATTTFSLLQDTYLADGQTRRWRFLLLRDDATLSGSAQAAQRASAAAAIALPLLPMATHASWRATHALGLLGGPGTAPSDAAVQANIEWNDWSAASHFGPWGGHGDPLQTSQTGTPRNHPLSPQLAHAVQSRDSRLLVVLEQMAWTQALRPLHLYGLRVATSDPLFLWGGLPGQYSPESLGRRRLLTNDPYAAYRTMVPGGAARTHNFEPFDVEHWSTDLLFDYWTITGDAWAREELRQMGETLRGLLRPVGYYTSNMLPARAEGWVMQGFVQAFLATDDLRFRDAALDRVHDIVLRDRGVDASRALAVHGSDPRTGWPAPYTFYMPWQHGAVLYGYLAAWKFFGDPECLALCNDVARCVEYAWVRDVTVPTFGFVPNGMRYYVPVTRNGAGVAPSFFDASFGIAFGDEPLGGAHSFLLGGLLMLAQTATKVEERARAQQFGELLLQAPLSEQDRWNKWFSAVPTPWN